MREIHHVRVIAWKKPRKSALILCRDHTLNQSLRIMWEKDGYTAQVVNTVPDAHLWWRDNAHLQPDDFTIALVTFRGRGRDYWHLFLAHVASEHLPPVEVDL